MLQVILILILISSGSPRLNKQTIRNTSLRPLSANKRIVCAIGHGCHRRRPGSVGQEGGGFMVANYGLERTDQVGPIRRRSAPSSAFGRLAGAARVGRD